MNIFKIPGPPVTFCHKSEMPPPQFHFNRLKGVEKIVDEKKNNNIVHPSIHPSIGMHKTKKSHSFAFGRNSM